LFLKSLYTCFYRTLLDSTLHVNKVNIVFADNKNKVNNVFTDNKNKLNILLVKR